MNKEIGDIVAPGDTVFSYMYLDYLMEQENVNKEVDVLINYRKAKIECEEVSNEIKIKEAKIKELKEDIAKETHNIMLGISNNVYKLDLERQLQEVQMDLQAQKNVMKLLKKQSWYLQPIITQYFIDNKSEIWLLFLIAHSKR